MLSYGDARPARQDKSQSAVALDRQSQREHQRQPHLWLVTGPAGCGKTTVAKYLADSLGYPFIEGDQIHPPANVDKMRSGIPLTDSDRWDWLTELRKLSNNRINDGADGVVVACSALKLKYRDVIRVAAYYDRSIAIHFIFLHAPQALLMQRVAERQGHYMQANMVKSQFDILELPRPDEFDVITVDASQESEQVQNDALVMVKAVLATGI